MSATAPSRKLPRITAAMVYDATNVVALCAVGGGVWAVYGGGAASIAVGALALALNLLTLFRRR